jgi:MFS family permease
MCCDGQAWNERLIVDVQDPDYIWISLIYTLASAITLLLIGRISDVFGRR